MRFLRDRSGQGILEYGLIVGLVAMVAIGALLAFGGGTSNSLNASANAMNESRVGSGFVTGGG